MMSRIYPDYGEPGAPNLDPYYISPEEERRREDAVVDSIQSTIQSYGEDLAGVLEDLKASLKCDGAELVSVTIDPVTLAVEIKVKP